MDEESLGPSRASRPLRRSQSSPAMKLAIPLSTSGPPSSWPPWWYWCVSFAPRAVSSLPRWAGDAREIRRGHGRAACLAAVRVGRSGSGARLLPDPLRALVWQRRISQSAGEMNLDAWVEGESLAPLIDDDRCTVHEEDTCRPLATFHLQAEVERGDGAEREAGEEHAIRRKLRRERRSKRASRQAWAGLRLGVWELTCPAGPPAIDLASTKRVFIFSRQACRPSGVVRMSLAMIASLAGPAGVICACMNDMTSKAHHAGPIGDDGA